MNFKFETWPIKKLLKVIDEDSIDLKPSFQRNFIWSLKEQKQLIDSVIKYYPLPTFFIYKENENSYVMVDGQQRSRSLYLFHKGDLTDSYNNEIGNINKDNFYGYPLNISLITGLDQNDSLEAFYSLVNKTGKRLNIPELYKAQYHGKNFLKLVEELLEYTPFQNLELFTESVSRRMNDRYFVEELVAYLEKKEILDKKKYVKTIYERDIDYDEYNDLKEKFTNIIDKIYHLSSNIFPINNTRYKQRADFYTLFNFIHKHSIKIEILKEMYKILLVIADDISPSNDDCEVLQSYANNCVSQSNSKIARNNRLVFFENLLLNNNKEGNKMLNEIINYFVSFYNIENINLNKINGYYLMDYSKIDEEKNILIK